MLTILGSNTFYDVSYFGEVEGTYYFNTLTHTQDGSSIKVKRGAIDQDGYVFHAEVVTLVLMDNGTAALSFQNQERIIASWKQEGKKVKLSYRTSYSYATIVCERGFSSMTFTVSSSDFQQTYYLTKY